MLPACASPFLIFGRSWAPPPQGSGGWQSPHSPQCPAPGPGHAHGSIPTTAGTFGQRSSPTSLPAHLGLLDRERAFQWDTRLVNPVLMGLQWFKLFTS